MDILNEKIEGLVKKAEKSKMPYGILKKVYDRGMAAWKTGHRPGTTPQQWAFARVNSFITKSSGTWGKADKDLAKQVRGEEVERRKTASEMLGQVRETNLREALASENGGPQIMFYYSVGPQPFSDDQKKAAKLIVKIIKKQFNKLPNKLGVPYGRGTIADLPVPNLRGNFAGGAIDLQGSIESHIAFQTELKKQMPNIKLYYGTPHIFSLMKFSDWDRRFPIKLTKYKVIAKGPNANTAVDNVYEKLDKDADAGDYVKDFRKSDAPQFKGKSDKKKQKMAIAAYLDSKEEVDLDEALKFKYAVVDTSKNNEVVSMSSDEKDMKDSMRRKNKGSLKIVKLKRPVANDKMIGYPLKEENCPDCDEDPCKCKPLQESGHTDVASMKTQVQIATDALQKMNTELGKLSDEEDLPTWWTNKVATAVSKLDGMADYIDAKSDQGEKMNEDNITEEKVFVVRFEKEGMRFAVPFRKASMAYDGKKILAKSAGVSNLSVTQDVLKPGVKFSAENFGKIVKESRMGEYFLDMQMDAQDMKERDFINKYKGEMGMNANELKRMYKEFNEEVVKEAVAQNDAFVVTGGPGDNAQKVIAVFKDKGNGLKDAKKARDDYDKKNNPTKQSHKARIYRQTRLSQSNNRLKPGEKIMYSTFGNKQQFTKLKEDIQVEEVDNSLMAQATRVISQTSIKEKIDPADVDNIATADDRKAADKNIIIQLRRAQDMQGKADVTFKDKPNKKEKIDIKVINKALDMFDKMRPNDKTKMQTMIGKSYRDLLKTVQRGRI